MAEQPPTVEEINAGINARMELELERDTPLPQLSLGRIVAKVTSGAIAALYRFVAFVGRQQFPRTAQFGNINFGNQLIDPLVELGDTINEGPPGEATRAELLVELTVTQQGGTLRAGAPLVSNDNGVTYVTTASTLLNAPTVTTVVRASEDQNSTGGVGPIGNLSAGAPLVIVNTPGALNPTAVVVAQVVTASDAETEQAYRARVDFAYKRRPQGGAPRDYQQWALEVEGVAAAYPYTGDPGIVNVYVEATPASSGSPDGIPTTAQLTAVSESIELNENGLANRRPISSAVAVLPITRQPYDVEVLGLSAPTGTDSRITDALSTYFLTRAPFIVGLDLNATDTSTIRNGDISTVVGDVTRQVGGSFNDVLLRLNGLPITVDILGEGVTAKLGDVTFGS